MTFLPKYGAVLLMTSFRNHAKQSLQTYRPSERDWRISKAGHLRGTRAFVTRAKQSGMEQVVTRGRGVVRSSPLVRRQHDNGGPDRSWAAAARADLPCL